MEALRVMWWLLALGLTTAMAGEQSAPPRSLDEQLCTLAIPKDSGWSWGQITPQLAAAKVAALAHNDAEDSFVFVTVIPESGSRAFNDKRVEEFKAGMAKSAEKTGAISFGSTTPIVTNGVPGFAISAETEAADKSKTYFAVRMFVANDRHYAVQAVSSTGPPSADATQRKILDSFDFVGEPKKMMNPIAYQIGQIVGAGLFLAVLAAIILVAIRAGRRSRSASSLLP